MLFPERMLHTANTIPEGCSGHICQVPANTYRKAALIFPIKKYEQNISSSSRSTNRQSKSRTSRDNLRTLSPNLREICIRKSFAPGFTLQNREDCGLSGRQIHPYIDQFCPELALKATIKIRSGRSPQCVTLRYGGLSAAS